MKPEREDGRSAARPPPMPDAEAAVRYRTLFDTANDAIFLMRGDRFIECNPMTLKMFGCTAEKILGQPPYRFSPPTQPDGRDSTEAANERIRAAIEEGPQFFEWTHIRYDGTPFFAEVSLNRVELHGEVFLQAAVRDITRRKQALDRLRSSEATYRSLFENASDAIVVCAASTEILDANPRAAELTGYPLGELRGLRMLDLYVQAPEDDLQASLRTVLKGGVTARFRRIRRKDGSIVDVEGRASLLPDGTIIALYRDVTGERRREEERQRLERIESLGILAGGIAHDFNNIMASALGFLELGRQRAVHMPDVASALDRAADAIDRARSLTQQLLTFSRGGEPVRRVVALGALVRDTAEFALRGSNVACRLDLPDDLWPVDADEGQIAQVVHNLVLNAQQSMPGGGEVRVRAGNVRPGADDRTACETGPLVAIEVTDRGGGIPADVLPRIFDPYFTTKTRGVGLGLPTAYRIVQRHGGHLFVDDSPGGTTFTVLLPAMPGAVVEPSGPPASSPARGRGRILVMDDEAGIRSLLSEALAASGYHVCVTENGRRAAEECARARDEGRPFDVAIMDLTIPGGIGGRETLPLLRAIDPGIRAIVSSGYSNDPVMSRFQDEGFDGVCVKPYRLSHLRAEVERVLGLDRPMTHDP